MFTNTLYRLGGFTTIITAVFTAVFNILAGLGVVPPAWNYPGFLVINLLLFFSALAVYRRQAERAGILGLASFFLITVTQFLGVAFNAYATFAVPVLRQSFPEAIPAVLGGPMGGLVMAIMILGLLGPVLFVIATLRARVFSPLGAWVLLMGTLLGLAALPFNLSTILASVGLAMMGYAMWSGQGLRERGVQVQPAAGD